jgi:membrane protein YqaA with SNARE-associated domain
MAAAWGLAEATLFFLVPDVWLTWLALEAPRRAFRACLWALAGALAGGLLMFAWGAADGAGAEAALDAVPGVSPAMIAGVRSELAVGGAAALFLGPLRGVPYKLYAVETAVLHQPLASFLLVSVPARLLRFLAVTALVAFLARGPLRRLGPRGRRSLHLLAWALFYTAYFLWIGGGGRR